MIFYLCALYDRYMGKLLWFWDDAIVDFNPICPQTPSFPLNDTASACWTDRENCYVCVVADTRMQ
jgi:hypothetical protein